MRDTSIIEILLRSPEPSVRWKVRSETLAEDPSARRMVRLREEVRQSPRVRTLLAPYRVKGPRARWPGVYDKWHGVHWILASIADLGYPEEDPQLAPLRDAVLRVWLRRHYFRDVEINARRTSARTQGVPLIQGRARRCASQQGNALYFLARLGIEDERSAQLAERLLHWRWPDGGWNCDLEPSADSSSFMETRHPMLGLHLYGMRHGDSRAAKAAAGASEVFLRRRLFRRVSDDQLMRPEFVKLHYPLYWHYDILGGLRAMRELGRLGDPRCSEALDLLESKRLPEGGWPAEQRYYRVDRHRGAICHDVVDWGGTSVRRPNPWVTADALSVLAASGRLEY